MTSKSGSNTSVWECGKVEPVHEPTNIDVPTAGGYVFLQPSPVVPPTLMQIYRRLAIEARSLWFPKAIVWFS